MTEEIKELEARLKELKNIEQQKFLENEIKLLEAYVGKYFKIGDVCPELVKVTGVEDNRATVICNDYEAIYSGVRSSYSLQEATEITEEEFNKELNKTLCHLNPNQPQEVEVWAYMAGEYAAFHETHIRVVYDLTNKLIINEDWFEDGVEITLKRFEETGYSGDDSCDFAKLKALKVDTDYYLKL